MVNFLAGIYQAGIIAPAVMEVWTVPVRMDISSIEVNGTSFIEKNIVQNNLICTVDASIQDPIWTVS